MIFLLLNFRSKYMPDKKVLTKDVLAVVAAGGLVLGSAVAPGLPILVGVFIKIWKNANKTDVGRIITRLKKQEMISVGEKDGKTTLEITEKGKRRLLQYDFENLKLKSKRRDGKWRLIIFDIPEYKKKARDIFRDKLKSIGLVRLQDSCFVSAFPCKDEVDFLSNYLDLVDFVTIFSINKTESGEELIFKKYYGDFAQ